MRRKITIGCLLFAWLCANGAIWNVVQMVGWTKMIHDYSQVMPVAQALRITFDGSAPCNLCELTKAAQDAARQELPREAATSGSMDKLVLMADGLPFPMLIAPTMTWPVAYDKVSRCRPKSVPVPPPRV